MNPQIPRDRLDEATSRRLSRLAAMPVDTSHLDLRLADEIPLPQQRPATVLRMRWLRAAAASIGAVLAVGAVIWSLSGGPVLASANLMAQFHNDLVSGNAPATQATSIAEANQKLKHQWDHGGLELPRVPTSHVMTCCMRSVEDKRVACVLLKTQSGIPVTMAVAKAMDMKVPHGQRVIRGGSEFHVQAGTGGLNMVSTERGGRWICLIGSLPTDDLIDIGAAIEF
jgi:hypothetical protein